MLNGIRNAAVFGVNFLRNPSRNASLVPSSVYAARALLAGIDFDRIHSVVELGPGTGVFTKVLLEMCRPDTKVILIEIEDSYLPILRGRFGDAVTLEHEGAHALDAILSKHDLDRADLVISGLPFLHGEDKAALTASLTRQTDQGTEFRFFTYMPPVMKKVYSNLPLVRKSFVPLNVPPMWIYGIN